MSESGVTFRGFAAAQAECDRRGRRGPDEDGTIRVLVPVEVSGRWRVGFGVTWREWCSRLHRVSREFGDGSMVFDDQRQTEDAQELLPMRPEIRLVPTTGADR